MDDHLTIHFDGSCLPKNPGGTAKYGFEIRDSKNNIVHTGNAVVCSGPSATNNVAEWAGLTAALRYLKSIEWGSPKGGFDNRRGSLSIRGDSKLVICQLNNEWKCNKPHLQSYLTECQSLLGEWN